MKDISILKQANIIGIVDGYLENNPNGLSHILLVGMDADKQDIPIMPPLMFSCDTESGFGGKSTVILITSRRCNYEL